MLICHSEPKYWDRNAALLSNLHVLNSVPLWLLELAVDSLLGCCCLNQLICHWPEAIVDNFILLLTRLLQWTSQFTWLCCCSLSITWQPISHWHYCSWSFNLLLTRLLQLTSQFSIHQAAAANYSINHWPGCCSWEVSFLQPGVVANQSICHGARLL